MKIYKIHRLRRAMGNVERRMVRNILRLNACCKCFVYVSAHSLQNTLSRTHFSALSSFTTFPHLINGEEKETAVSGGEDLSKRNKQF